MEEEKKKTNKDGGDIKVAGRLFKCANGYIYRQVVSEYDKAPTTKTELKKVATTVATFLTDDRNGFKKIR